MKLAWLTDIHMNFVSDSPRQQLYADVIDAEADAVLIGGDIGEADSFAAELSQLAAAVGRPCYFVLGNHDYYRSSIEAVRSQASALGAESDNLSWLPAAGVITFDRCETVLIGHGGWGDGRAGDFFGSDIMLNDYLMIDELRDALGDITQAATLLPAPLFAKLNSLGDECAAWFDQILPTALGRAQHVVVLLHVPPFLESCWYEGKISDNNWSPHFVCQAAGESLKRHMSEHPAKSMTVLCGHTHGAGTVDILPNLSVLTGGAEYGMPMLQQVLAIK